MNDFTKEELECILYDLKRNDNPWLCGESIENKLQSLIDNYCEHKENVTTLYTISGDYPFGGFCRDCGSLVDEAD